MKKVMSVIFLLLSNFLMEDMLSQHRFTLEFLPGVSGALPMPLNVYQEGAKVASFTARYETRSLEMPFYYSYRIGYQTDSHGWELEMNHLKIYLINTNDVVSHFSVSHGYNQLWLNHTWINRIGIFRVGLGPVISHDETTVNGKRLEETGGFFNAGYNIHGGSLQSSFQKRYYVWDHLFISAEAKLNFGYAHIGVVDGYATTPIIAGHLLFGAGVSF
ncbi:hypothetical protein ACE01N_13725 [Saccharicrinis sp. FJH2]|uniref:hypothetical protein n=1 Tax=Saccharicrinis sp. FJH65 TaxID=3344659 RepID=UPI0035F21FA5